MTIYKVAKLMEKTRELAADYHATTGDILPVSNELARYDVCSLLGYLVADKNDPFDCVGSGDYSDKKLQIKSRVLIPQQKSRPMVGQLNVNGDWDYTILVVYNNFYKPKEIISLSKDVLNCLLETESKKKSKGSISVAKFQAVGKKIWNNNK